MVTFKSILKQKIQSSIDEIRDKVGEICVKFNDKRIVRDELSDKIYEISDEIIDKIDELDEMYRFLCKCDLPATDKSVEFIDTLTPEQLKILLNLVSYITVIKTT